MKGPPERGAVILWLPGGRRARHQEGQPRRQLRGRRTAGEPPKRLGNRLVSNANALGDEAVRVAKVTKPGRVWRYPAVHRSGLDPTKDELPGNASAGANAIVAGPPLLSRRKPVTSKPRETRSDEGAIKCAQRWAPPTEVIRAADAAKVFSVAPNVT